LSFSSSSYFLFYIEVLTIGKLKDFEIDNLVLSQETLFSKLPAMIQEFSLLGPKIKTFLSVFQFLFPLLKKWLGSVLWIIKDTLCLLID
jgi:hypothetical protein